MFRIWLLEYRSIALFDGQLELVSEPADAGPALGLHLVEVLQAGQVSCGIGSSSFGSFLADGVSSSEIVHAGDLHRFGALVGLS